MIAPYIYPQGGEAWDLSDILPTMEAAFKARGWDINTTPMVGVPLSYGGANGYTVPTAAQAETETKAFCQAGATALIYYDFGTGTNASTDTGVQQGIKAGIADCKAIWGTTSTSPIATPSSGLVPTCVCAGGINCAGTPSPTMPANGSVTPSLTSGATIPVDSTTPNPSGAITDTPSISGAPSTSVIPSDIGTLPISGDGSLLDLLKQFINFLVKLINQLFGGSGNQRHHRHHNRN